MSIAKLEIPVDRLRRLPSNAEYRAKSGRASAVVKSQGDTIIVYATCDSLQRWCEYYERESSCYKTAFDNLRSQVLAESEKRSNPIKMVFIAFLVGVATGILITRIIRKI